MENPKCMHEWKPSGIWDGVTLDGKLTGGQIYVCTRCGDKAYSKKEIAEKGGKIFQGMDVFGRPINKG